MACSWAAVSVNGSASRRARASVPGGGERDGDVVLALAPPAGEADLEHEQLLEREPAPRSRCLVERARPVHRMERIPFRRQLQARP